MKSLAQPAQENVAVRDVLLETVVSAHYLALQMRLLAGMADFPGHAETELMANALSRWAQLADANWSGGQFEDEEIARSSHIRAEAVAGCEFSSLV